MKKLLVAILLFMPFAAWGQINYLPPNSNLNRPITNALGLSRYNAPYNQDPDMWLIVDQVTPSLSACLSSNYTTCFPGGIRFRVDSLLASSATLTGTQGLVIALSTPSSSSAACVTGAIWADSQYVYVCIATNSIRRSALATF